MIAYKIISTSLRSVVDVSARSNVGTEGLILMLYLATTANKKLNLNLSFKNVGRYAPSHG